MSDNMYGILLDSAQLDADLTSVASAIRGKTGDSAQLAFPSEFVSAIADIPSGQTVYFSTFNGAPYVKDVIFPLSGYGNASLATLQSCSNLESVTYSKPTLGYLPTGQYNFAYNTALKTVVLDASINSVNNNREFQSCTALTTVQLGGIGHYVNALHGNFFAGCTQSGLTITIYVRDTATIPLAGSPWGATNATIVYRSSTTGEVRIE